MGWDQQSHNQRGSVKGQQTKEWCSDGELESRVKEWNVKPPPACERDEMGEKEQPRGGLPAQLSPPIRPPIHRENRAKDRRNMGERQQRCDPWDAGHQGKQWAIDRYLSVLCTVL